MSTPTSTPTEHPTAENIAERVKEIRGFVPNEIEKGILFADISTRGWIEHGKTFKHYDHPVIAGSYNYDGALMAQLRADVRELLGFVEHLLAERVEMLREIYSNHEHIATKITGDKTCECKFCQQYRTLTQKGETNGTV